MFKKFLAIALSLCLTLAICSAAFAAEKGDKEKIPNTKTAPQVISVLGRLAKLADSSEADEDESFLELLGGKDALESGKYNENYEKIFTKLYNATTVDDIMSLLGVKEDNDITIRNYFGIDADAFDGVDPSAEITDEFVANIGKILGYEDVNLEDLLSTLFAAAMISVYYPSLEIDMADLVATLEGLSDLYEAGYFDDIDLADEKVIADLASEFGIDFEDIQSAEQLRENSKPQPEAKSKTDSEEIRDVIQLLYAYGLDDYLMGYYTYQYPDFESYSDEQLAATIREFADRMWEEESRVIPAQYKSAVSGLPYSKLELLKMGYSAYIAAAKAVLNEIINNILAENGIDVTDFLTHFSIDMDRLHYDYYSGALQTLIDFYKESKAAPAEAEA